MIKVAELSNGKYMVIKTFLGMRHCAYDSVGTPWYCREYQIKYCQLNSKEDAFAVARKLDVNVVKWVKE